MASRDLTIPSLQRSYQDGSLSPSQLIAELYPLLAAEPNAFITLAPLDTLLSQARQLEAHVGEGRGPLWGIPFAVKDNIDAVPFPTTAACESFRYSPERSAPVVKALVDAGGIVVGKTNMDQFAAGLVGSRSPFGTARNAFDDRFVPGGSSSGSGALVGAGCLTFTLGTDTAGSGRVPAMFNGCVGVKPTVGRLSTRGVVPACASLDCVSVFAQTVADAAAVVRVAQVGELSDERWRPPPPGLGSLRFQAGQAFRFALPGPRFADFSGPGGESAKKGYEALFEEAAQRLVALGGERVEDFDFRPFSETADMLYQSAFLAERYAGIATFIEADSGSIPKVKGGEAVEAAEVRRQLLQDKRFMKVTAAILSGAVGKSAVELYQDLDGLKALTAAARVQLGKVDLLLVPTALQHYTLQEVAEQEALPELPTWPRNGNLGRFTNFVNLLDMCGIAVPSGLLTGEADAGEGQAEEVAARRKLLVATGNTAPVLPFGVTLLGPAWSDEFLWDVAEALYAASGLTNGPAGHSVLPYRT